MPNNQYNSYQTAAKQIQENYGAFSIAGALKTPNYGNYNVSNMFQTAPDMPNNMYNMTNMPNMSNMTNNPNSTYDITLSPDMANNVNAINASEGNCVLSANCSTCPKKYKSDIKRLYEGVL
jgi:hypothetical protein